MNAGDLSALVQQFLLFHGARYTSRVDEENWKTVPVTLQVPAQPIDALQLAAGEWVVVPWRLAGADHLQLWLERLSASGSRPRVIVLTQDRPLAAEHHVTQLANAHRLELVALTADPPGVAGTAQAALVVHAFDADMQRSMAACNPLVHLAATGDARDPQVFLERLRHAAPQVPVTRAMTALNLLVYVAMVFAAAARPEGGLWSTVAGGFGTAQLVGWGANASGHMADQPWRLLSSAFLHGNLLHIAMNMMALWQLGAMAERLLGSRAFGAAYVLSALGGAVASFGWHALQVGPSVSVGASGAVFGVLGATVGFALARRDTIPAHVYRSLLRSGGMFVLINVGLGLAVPVIDNAAHLGGLIVGTAAGAALSRELPPGPQPALGVQAAIVLGFLLVLGVAFRVSLGLDG